MKNVNNTLSISINPEDNRKTGDIITIFPQDEIARRKVMDTIREESLTDIGSILRLIDEQEFSSNAIKKDTQTKFENLFKIGALNPTKLQEEKDNTVQMKVLDFES